MGKGAKWRHDYDTTRERSARVSDRSRAVSVSAAEPGARRRWMCWACTYRWVATIRHLCCPRCKEDAVEERI